MSLYELESMFRALAKLDGTRGSAIMTEEQFDAAKDKWRRMGLKDVKV